MHIATSRPLIVRLALALVVLMAWLSLVLGYVPTASAQPRTELTATSDARVQIPSSSTWREYDPSCTYADKTIRKGGFKNRKGKKKSVGVVRVRTSDVDARDFYVSAQSFMKGAQRMQMKVWIHEGGEKRLLQVVKSSHVRSFQSIGCLVPRLEKGQKITVEVKLAWDPDERKWLYSSRNTWKPRPIK